MTHVRTEYRLIPTGSIRSYGPVNGSPRQIYITDEHSATFENRDGITLRGADEARQALSDIRALLAAERKPGVYARLVEPGRLRIARRWTLWVHHPDAGERIYRFAREIDARRAFEGICSMVRSLDVGPTMSVLIH